MTGLLEAEDYWRRAVNALLTAECIAGTDFEGAANRAYYSAFYAVSALFALDGVTFRKHQAVESAVHRDLVNTGKWPDELGDKYKRLHRLRITGDYGSLQPVSVEEAGAAVAAARDILCAIRDMRPDVFDLP